MRNLYLSGPHELDDWEESDVSIQEASAWDQRRENTKSDSSIVEPGIWLYIFCFSMGVFGCFGLFGVRAMVVVGP